jgi:curved DNA-binding protein CbpA
VTTQVPPLLPDGPARRSTRIVRAVPLLIFKRDDTENKEPEQTATISINCHGCRYFSQIGARKGSWLTVQVGTDEDNSSPQKLDAKVAWVQKSQRLSGLFQVGIEFASPQDVWHVEDPPEDWRIFTTPEDAHPTATLVDIERMLQMAHAGTYYQLLGVQSDSTRAQIKHRFYQLARSFHPDHHMERPEWTPRLLLLMDSLNLAYKTLSDEDSKKQYDERLQITGIFRIGKERTERERLAYECLQKARECLAAKNFAGAILWLRRAIEAEPESARHRVLLGRSLAAVPEYRGEAIEQFEKAIALDPFNVTAHFQYAQMLEKMKLPGRARFHYEQVLELDREHKESRERLQYLERAGPRSVLRPSLLNRLTRRR